MNLNLSNDEMTTVIAALSEARRVWAESAETYRLSCPEIAHIARLNAYKAGLLLDKARHVRSKAAS